MRPFNVYIFHVLVHVARASSLGPRPSRDSFTKEGLVSNVGMLGCAESACSETGNPIRSLDLKLSCDIKVVPHGTRMRGPEDRIYTTQIGTKSHDCQVAC